ncbi:hypothetical protein MJO28_014277 [Puccinia striiformis f. sp. tritici]|uniref:Uncharacterized protein n=1 Tax=Puccinia striiformis f. sp. tritici TaxID=168172 RepID=A0ACC0DW03_9BASI|nr:hypothetical protein MJO28_014277 [Puccinia striiformis f. sp. tritici]
MHQSLFPVPFHRVYHAVFPFSLDDPSHKSSTTETSERNNILNLTPHKTMILRLDQKDSVRFVAREQFMPGCSQQFISQQGYSTRNSLSDEIDMSIDVYGVPPTLKAHKCAIVTTLVSFSDTYPLMMLSDTQLCIA